MARALDPRTTFFVNPALVRSKMQTNRGTLERLLVHVTEACARNLK
jgi:hypothetical protein